MQKPSLSDAQLIVVELGAEWPIAALTSSPSARRVLAQDESEAPVAFAARVGEQLNDLQARGVALGGAVLACSERLDPPAQAARAELARAAASALARNRGGELDLVASDRNEGRSRAALSGLVGELCKEWQSAAVVTTLRFGAVRVEAQARADSDESSAEAKSRTAARRGAGTGNANGKGGSRRVA